MEVVQHTHRGISELRQTTDTSKNLPGDVSSYR